MQLKSIQLENLFCYRDVKVGFQRGVSVFAGPNGSGKSSLLEGIFFALFGSNIKPITGREMAAVLREGSAQGAVRLAFQFDQHHYRVQMALKRSGQRVAADGKRCILERDDGEKWSGVTDVTEQIKTLLHMNAEDFANCLYVRQGEVDRLIKATPAERQSDLDRLLQLDSLDRYEQRIKEGVNRALNRCTQQFQGRIEAKKEDLAVLNQNNLLEQKTKLERELLELDKNQRSLVQRESELNETLRARQQQIEQFKAHLQIYGQSGEKIAQIKQQLQTRSGAENELRQKLQQLQASTRDIEMKLQETQKDPLWTQLQLSPETSLIQLLQQFERQLPDLEQTLQQQRDKLIHTRSDKARAENDLKRIRTKIKAQTSQLETKQTALSGLQTTLQERLKRLEIAAPQNLEALDLIGLQSSLNKALERCREQMLQLQTTQAKAQAARSELERQAQQAQELIRAGKCPTCQQAVTVETLADHTQHLQRRQAPLDQELQSLSAQLVLAQQQLDRTRARQTELAGVEAAFFKWQLEREQIAQQQHDLQRQREEKQSLTVTLEKLCREDEAASTAGAAGRAQFEQRKQQLDFVKKIAQLREHKTSFREKQQLQRQALREFIKHTDRLKQDLADNETAQETAKTHLGQQDAAAFKSEWQQLQTQLQTLKAQQKSLTGERDQRQQQLGKVHDELKRQKVLQAKIDTQNDRLNELKKLIAEVEILRALYAEIKISQRRKNLQALNGMFNHFFKLMDSGASYDRVQLNENFDIQIVLNDGAILSPSLLSGGERALINLALRAAMHRVICEAGGVLLPLFFDEPTVFLDEDRIHRLERLFEELGQQVGQVIVVSHEDALVESADHEYRLNKDVDNISHVEKVR